MKVSVLFTGRSYQTGGQLPGELEVPSGARVSDAIRMLEECLPDGEQLPPSCLVAVSGEHIGTVAQLDDRSLDDGQELVLIAPVAGG